MIRNVFRPWLMVLLMAPLTALAAGVNVGEKLSSLSIAELGECVLEGDDAVFKPWDTSKLNGKVYVIEHVAARQGIDSINKEFFDALKAAGITHEEIGFVRFVNSDDALWGTSGLVAGEIKKNKKMYPDDVFVVDAEGLGLDQWGLTQKSAALIVIDASGKVLAFKDGGMSGEEIQETIGKLKSQLALAANP